MKKNFMNPIVEILKDLPELEIGKQYKTHHCKEGRNNDRLYILRVDSKYYIYNCFHCGINGSVYYSKETSGSSYLLEEKERVAKKSNPIYLPKDITIGSIPSKFNDFLKKYDLTLIDLNKYGVCYSPYWDRLICPIYSNTDLTGWAGRSVDKDPKWFLKSDKKLQYLLPKSSLLIVLVEDIISGYKIHLAGFSSLVLFGTSLKSGNLDTLSTYENIVVWLDNDNHIVKDSVNKLENYLSLTGKNVITIRNHSDPKKYSYGYIEEILYDRGIRHT